VLNTIPFGIGVAASTRVGNLLGLQSAIGAKRAAHASALLSVIVGSIVMIVMMATKDVGLLFLFPSCGSNSWYSRGQVFGYLFSDDLDVVMLVSQVMPLVASFQVGCFGCSRF
jgi:MATE family multidrug resistance protein